tara:strand:+ start:3124 stop:3465 length:342 start_codon:yes stop_codon:yes gene_type:complete
MSAIDKAKNHYKTQFAMDLQGPLNVPEWELNIYYRNTMTMSQQSQILELHQQNKLAEATIMLLIVRALDEDGVPLFKKMEKTELMKSVDSDVISRVVGEITSADADAEDSLGN